ncbi:MAG: hypothetical protein ACW98X_27105, partial [Promethearchaeota archaeon]
ENVFKWIKKREQIYHGEYKNKIPDILFELEGEYGVGMDFFTSAVTPNYTHKKISGGHKSEAVLLTYCNNAKIKIKQRPDTIVGIKDHVLEMLND